MFESILALVRSLGAGQSDAVDSEDQQLIDNLGASDERPLDAARAILLVDLALIDGHFDARERQVIMGALKKDLGISDEEADTLVQGASGMVQFRGSHAWATEIRRRIDLESRKKIMETVRKLIMADAQEDGFETYLEKKFRDILGV